MERDVKVTHWAEVRAEVEKANPELTKLIDQLNPNKTYKLIKARYLFGDLIVENGIPNWI